MAKMEAPDAFLQQMGPEDIESELEPDTLALFKQLPGELWNRHFQNVLRIEQRDRDEGPDAVKSSVTGYLTGVLSQRENAIESYEVGDPELRPVFEALPEGDLKERLRLLLLSPEPGLGAGQTARVKSMTIESYPRPIAVKYLLTPTGKTLSVEGEYDTSREVETITHIEKAETDLGAGENIRVPHPLFYYKRGKLQCYGMSQVDGVTLDRLTTEAAFIPDELIGVLREKYASREARDALLAEIDLFMQAVHRECLHGDIKLRNVMVDGEGVFYLIDFGQAVHMNTMSEGSRDQFDELQAEERRQLRECIVSVLNTL